MSDREPHQGRELKVHLYDNGQPACRSASPLFDKPKLTIEPTDITCERCQEAFKRLVRKERQRADNWGPELARTEQMLLHKSLPPSSAKALALIAQGVSQQEVAIALDKSLSVIHGYVSVGYARLGILDPSGTKKRLALARLVWEMEADKKVIS